MNLLYYLVMMVVALGLQHGVSDLVAIRGVSPDFILIAVCAVSLFAGRGQGTLWGAGIGFIADSLSGSLLGSHALALSLVGFISGSVMSYRSLQSAYSLNAGAIVGVLAVLQNLLLYIINIQGTAGALQGMIQAVLLPAIYTLFWALIIFAIVPQSIWEKIYKTEPTPLF
ncbi:MAG TPA: rod shape-determining protein MreD [bacterium]|nr:rod shape-determining protein MreD [bacterium]HQG45464.1 rod shape-determining protein MreD [bacterium]HQI47261.1 rod shape-determining protein MreD [bacterium]HQJ64230.1 rod shape-determining protein MreD [bacterium]